MTAHAYRRRLAAVEALESARIARVVDRICRRMERGDMRILLAFLERRQVNVHTSPTPVEQRMVEHADALILSDPEGRVTDCLTR